MFLFFFLPLVLKPCQTNALQLIIFVAFFSQLRKYYATSVTELLTSFQLTYGK